MQRSQLCDRPVGAVFLYSDLCMITLSLTLGKLVQQLKLVDQSDLLPACQGRCHVVQFVLTEKLSHSTCFFVTIIYIFTIAATDATLSMCASCRVIQQQSQSA